MTLVAEHIETDTRERILVVAERLFRQIGYQKTTVADIAKELRMSPANVYRFFDSKKAIHEGVARVLMGEVEIEARRIVAQPGPAKPRLRELLKTIHRMNSERYVGDSKLHEMVADRDGRGLGRLRRPYRMLHRHHRRGDRARAWPPASSRLPTCRSRRSAPAPA